MPNSRAVGLELRRAACAAIWSTIGSERSVVGMLWSVVAIVRSGPAHLEAALAQTREGLRRGHFVDQVQVDVQQRRSARLLVHDVGVPEFFDDRAWH